MDHTLHIIGSGMLDLVDVLLALELLVQALETLLGFALLAECICQLLVLLLQVPLVVLERFTRRQLDEEARGSGINIHASLSRKVLISLLASPMTWSN